MRAISVHVEELEYQRLKSLASLEGQPVAALIRRAMSHYLQREEPQGRSILDIPAHHGGRLLRDWTRGDLYDEMLGDRD